MVPNDFNLNYLDEQLSEIEFDKKKIKHLITEALKESEYHNRQLELEKLVTEKANSIKNHLKQLYSQDPSLPAKKTEEITKILQKIESDRILTETWIHIEIDSFHESIELKHDPSLVQKPFAIGDTVIILTPSKVAKKFGIKSSLPGNLALKICKELILIKPNTSKYGEEGEKIREIFREFDPDFESIGLDEGSLRVTELLINNGKDNEAGRQETAQLIRQKIFEKTGLLSSAGIGCNKALAKIACDLLKPNGQCYVPFDRDQIIQFMQSLKIKKIPGIGKTLKQTLNELGVFLCSDVASKKLDLFLGLGDSNFEFLARGAFGVGQAYHSEIIDQKCLTVSSSFIPTDDINKLTSLLQEFSKEISSEMAEKKASAKTISLNIKNFRFETKTKSENLANYISKETHVFEVALKLLNEFNLREKIRVLGMKASNLIYGQAKPEQNTSFSEEHKNQNKKTEAKPARSVTVTEQKCPICKKLFSYSSKRMQIHIDQCIVQGSSKPVRAKKRPKEPIQKNTLDQFFSKK